MRKNYILFLIITSFVLLVSSSYGQQQSQYSQYIYNTISVNPAYAGSRNVLSATVLYRDQWVGLEGSPKTQTLNIHAPIGRSEQTGLGVSIVNEEIGATRQTDIDIDFSYSIPISRTADIFFGLKAGGQLLDVNFEQLQKLDTGDRLLENNIDNKFSPNFGAGVYYRDSDLFYVGLSAPNVLDIKHFDSSALATVNQRIHYHLIGGYVFELNDELKFKPAFLSKLVSGSPIQVDVSANFLYNEKFTFGLSYRLGAAFSALVGFQISDSMMIGLAYDREITELGNTEFTGGSYEVVFRYELFRKYRRMLAPRFF